METNCPNILYLSGITIEECLQSKKTATDTLNTNDDEAEVEKSYPPYSPLFPNGLPILALNAGHVISISRLSQNSCPPICVKMSEERLRWAFSATFAAFHAPPLMLMCTIRSPKGGRPASC